MSLYISGVTVGSEGLNLGTNSLARTGREFFLSSPPKVGATAGWVVAGATNVNEATLPASQTGSTMVIPVRGFAVGDTITGFRIVAQVESAGGTVTIDADLRSELNAAADPTDSSIGAITQVSVTAQTAVSATKTGLSHVITNTRNYYILVTATTAGSTDIRFLGAFITLTQA